MTLGVILPRGQYDASCRDLGGPTWSAIPERAEEATYAEIGRLRQEVIEPRLAQAASRADHRGVGGVPPPLGLLAARHASEARGEAGVIKTTGRLLPCVDLLRTCRDVRPLRLLCL